MAYTFYFDASALGKRYAPEIGTAVVNCLFEHVPHERITCLTLGSAEVISVLVRKRNRGDIAGDLFDQACRDMEAEILHATDLRTQEARDALVVSAMPLIQQHSINSTDAVVLRSALDVAAVLQVMGDDVVLIASDLRLLRAARAEGLTVFNPETDPQSQLDALIVVV